jgi:hypothetical protein
MAGFAPVAAYLYWVFYKAPAFAVLPNVSYAPPPLGDYAIALGPAILLAIAAWRPPAPGSPERAASFYLAAWATIATLMSAIPTVNFSLQFQSGIGLPLLALGALGLARYRPAVLALAIAAMSSTAVIAYGIVLRDEPRWFAPSERVAVSDAVAASCRAGDVVMAPLDIGAYVNAFAPCQAYFAHGGYFQERAADVDAFYLQWDAGARRAFLDGRCITHVVLPASAAADATSWFGSEGGFRNVARVGAPPNALLLFSRARPARCEPSPGL